MTTNILFPRTQCFELFLRTSKSKLTPIKCPSSLEELTHSLCHKTCCRKMFGQKALVKAEEKSA